MDKFNKIKPAQILIISVIISLIGSIITDFGRANVYNQDSGVGGTIFVVSVLVLPVFFKKQRKYAWSRKGLLTLIIALVINLPFAIVSIMNHYHLK